MKAIIIFITQMIVVTGLLFIYEKIIKIKFPTWSNRNEDIIKRLIFGAVIGLITLLFANDYTEYFKNLDDNDKKTQQMLRSIILTLSQESNINKDIIKNVVIESREKFFPEETNKEAVRWAESFLSNIPQREKEIVELEIKDPELKLKYEKEWESLLSNVTDEFDTRIHSIKKEESNIVFEINEVDLFSSVEDETLRKVELPNGNYIKIYIIKPIVKLGDMEKGLRVVFTGSEEPSFSIDSFAKNGRLQYEIKPLMDRYSEFQYVTFNDPTADIEFNSKVQNAMNRLIDRAFHVNK